MPRNEESVLPALQEEGDRQSLNCVCCDYYIETIDDRERRQQLPRNTDSRL